MSEYAYTRLEMELVRYERAGDCVNVVIAQSSNRWRTRPGVYELIRLGCEYLGLPPEPPALFSVQPFASGVAFNFSEPLVEIFTSRAAEANADVFFSPVHPELAALFRRYPLNVAIEQELGAGWTELLMMTFPKISENTAVRYCAKDVWYYQAPEDRPSPFDMKGLRPTYSPVAPGPRVAVLEYRKFAMPGESPQIAPRPLAYVEPLDTLFIYRPMGETP